MRYERKYRIEHSSYESVLHEVMSNPAAYTTAFPDRKVNSIYYDDINYSAYNDNLLGVGHRVKYRVRWYGNPKDKITQPVLEKKIKKGQLGTKEYQKLNDFSLQDGAPELAALSSFPSNELYPHVVVRYDRTYLESMDGQIRATIDRNLEYVNVLNGTLSNQIEQDSSIILEIKYDQGLEQLADQSMQMIPYRLTKNSKYVTGMYHYLK